MRFILLLSLHYSFCNGIRELPSKAWVKPDQISVWGVHHKTGTVLLEHLAHEVANYGFGPVSLYLSTEECQDSAASTAYPDRCSWLRHSINQHAMFWSMDPVAYEKLQTVSNGSYKLVHCIRDPVGVVISAYNYHLHQSDVQIVPNTGPNVLQRFTIEEGLIHEAKMEYTSTLKIMLHMLQASRNDPNVLVVSLEDFVSNFDGTVAAVYQHLLGKDHPHLASLGELAKQYDLTRHPRSAGSHSTTSQQHEKAMSVVQSSSDPVWSDLRDLRTAFQYEFPDLDATFARTPNIHTSVWDILSHYE